MLETRPNLTDEIDGTTGGGGPDVNPLGNFRQSPLLRRSLKDFQRATGVAARLVPVALPLRRIPFGKGNNEFCRALVCSSCGCKACYRHQVRLLRQVKQKLKPTQVYCLAGMVQLAVPVLVAGRHVATIMGGQVCVSPPTRARFDLLAARLREWGMNGELHRMRHAWFRVPRLTRPQLRAAVRLLDQLAGLFAESITHEPATRSRTDQPCVAEAKQFVRLHLGERITTRDAAKALHLTESYFSRLFHRLTDLTFHAYVAAVRVEAAKAALADTHQRITEIAMAVGFQSVSDFNRVFKDRVRLTPSAYRLKHRNGAPAA
jgi:AraC-like DNA-binding protein/ligand-binding sensor protein